MSVTIEGVTYASHAEYFERFPWKRRENKKLNTPVYMAAISVPCADCKLDWHPMVMTLDHVDRDGYRTSTGERRYPSNMLSYPPETFLAEVAKCEAVCRNCHAYREFLRDGHHLKRRWQYIPAPVLGALMEAAA